MTENKTLSDNDLENVSGGAKDPNGQSVKITDFVDLQQYCVDACDYEFHEHMGNAIANNHIRNNKTYYFNTGYGYLKAFVEGSFDIDNPSGKSLKVLKITLPNSGGSKVYYCLADTIIEAIEYR